MATTPEQMAEVLKQLQEQMQQQNKALTDQVLELRDELVRQKARADTAENQLKAVESASTASAGTVQTAIEALGEVLKESKKDRPERSPILVDTKGIGKPTTFKNSEKTFHEWIGKLTNYLCAILGEATRPLLEWLSEQESEIGELDIDQDLWEHLPLSVPDFSNQVYHLLVNFTEGETYDLMAGTANLRGNGLDAWRRLHKRWDPAVAGRSRKLLRMITNPKQSSMKECLRQIHNWKQLVAKYERRRDATGKRRTLADDIKLSSFEALLPKELEDHILYNRQRLVTFEDCEAEIISILELKLGESIGEDALGTNEKDVNAFDGKGGKGGKKGKGGKGRG